MNKTILIVAVSTLLLGLALGYWMSDQVKVSTGVVETHKDSSKDEPLFYRNPMNPAITSPVPAKDEMGMDYIPVYADDKDGTEPAGTVTIDPVTVQNIGVRVAQAKMRELSREVRAVGRVDFDEEHLSRLHPKIEGWIEELRIDKTGEAVRKNSILLSIYSPQLVSSQEEYLLALKNKRTLADSPFEEIRQGANELVSSARERLVLLDVPEHQIHELEHSSKIKKTLHIHSPFDGVVLNIGAREGQFVTPKTELFRIADLSKVWVYVNIFEDDLPWIQEGDEAEMRVTGVPGRVFRGKISYIYPYLESKTRTVKVRMEFDNRNGLLKPEMFADVTVLANPQKNAVVIPSEAVVRSGNREQVFVVRAPGKFEPRDVVVGVASEGLTQIIKGIDVDETVVTSAQFLIDSESKLREATAKMLESGPMAESSVTDTEMDMSDMDRSDMSMEEDSVKDIRVPMTMHEGMQHD